MQIVKQDNFLFRPLERSDYDKGIFKALAQLTEVGDVTREKFERRFADFQQQPDVYNILVCEDTDTGTIAGCASLIVEKKLIRNCGMCGHIEDVVVDSKYRGKSLGLKLVLQLREAAERLGCYKVVLDCSEKNVPFYAKAGFTKKEVQMVWYKQKANL